MTFIQDDLYIRCPLCFRVTMSSSEPVIINDVLGSDVVYDDTSSTDVEVTKKHVTGSVIKHHHTRSPIFRRKVLDTSPSREMPSQRRSSSQEHRKASNDTRSSHDRQNVNTHNYRQAMKMGTGAQSEKLTPVDVSSGYSRQNDVIQNNLHSNRQPKRMESKSNRIPTADPREALMSEIRSSKLNLKRVSQSSEENEPDRRSGSKRDTSKLRERSPYQAPPSNRHTHASGDLSRTDLGRSRSHEKSSGHKHKKKAPSPPTRISSVRTQGSNDVPKSAIHRVGTSKSHFICLLYYFFFWAYKKLERAVWSSGSTLG